MVSAFAFGLRGGADPVARSTLGWSAILWLAHLQRVDVCIGSPVDWLGSVLVNWCSHYKKLQSVLIVSNFVCHW